MSNPRIVYTFYHPITGFKGQQELVDHWKLKWQNIGWTPKVLSYKDIDTNSDLYKRLHNFLAQTFDTNEPLIIKPYQSACFMRWLAFYNIGGGCMTDYDVLPYNFEYNPSYTPKIRFITNSASNVGWWGFWETYHSGIETFINRCEWCINNSIPIFVKRKCGGLVSYTTNDMLICKTFTHLHRSIEFVFRNVYNADNITNNANIYINGKVRKAKLNNSIDLVHYSNSWWYGLNNKKDKLANIEEFELANLRSENIRF